MTKDRPTGKRQVIKRLAISAAALVTIWHLFASFLWIAPPSALREVVPGDALQEYMIPMFGQSWSVFAPEPINGDYYFDVRAVVETDGEVEVTEWIRATDVEQSLATYRPFPPRAAKLANSQASTLKGEWESLSEAEQEIVGLNYFKEDWDERMTETLLEVTENEEQLLEYLEAEQRATAYATQVALAIWGDDVVRVQYQVARQNVVPFHQRNNRNAERPAIQPVPLGWRGLVVENMQSQEEFASYFCSAPLEVCQTDE
ncbi:DUF5819 family protein [Nesterenkonia sp.]|uniref:DUF5819 family protein n=1 Tax=Nesterenkonia sp. TaxID=704201 RepID=UPI002610AE08|nr:DUF5819 family protein [Nesterenkonia sp.]